MKKQQLKFEDASTFVFGKVPAQAIPLEEGVLGALLIDNKAYEQVEAILSPRSFYLDGHASIYEAIQRLVNNDTPIDLLTVTFELKKMNMLEIIGGPHYLVELTNKVASSANIEAHARTIHECFLNRQLISISNATINKAYQPDTDIFDLIDKAAGEIMALEAPYTGQRSYDGDDLVNAELQRIEELANSDKDMLGTPSGYRELDRALLGFEPEMVYVLAARPGMGKTALVLDIAVDVAVEQEEPIGLFLLEMSKIQTTQRLGARLAQIPLELVRMPNRMSPEQLKHYKQQLQKLNGTGLLVDDTPAINIPHIRRRVREWKKKHPGLKGIIVDYIQLMSGDGSIKGGNREQEVAANSRGLKAIAKEFGIFVIEVAQLSRAVETRGGSKRPQLSDLRESGSIEMDADMVAFIYRPEYYGIYEDEQGRSLRGCVEIIIAKNRHGKLDTIKLRGDLEKMTFTDWTDHDYVVPLEHKLQPIQAKPNPFDEDVIIPF